MLADSIATSYILTSTLARNSSWEEEREREGLVVAVQTPVNLNVPGEARGICTFTA
ncbi:MAG: hypothetical protein HY719_10205 [Planctomycetes bacterium]|nr:hypothetical protein [Planctomycetota bacterium]